MSREARIYTLAVIKDGEIIATKKVRSDVDGLFPPLGKEDVELKALEYGWMVRAADLLRDALHYEGRWKR